MNNQKFNIIKEICDDAPFGDINWVTVSFLTPEHIKGLESFQVFGLKIHNGYNDVGFANDDAKKIKAENPNHDVFVVKTGGVYAWDDTTKSEAFEYDNKNLNDLESNRRENEDRLKLVKEHLINEKTAAIEKITKTETTRNRLRQKLYERGLITKDEYEMIKESKKKDSTVKESVDKYYDEIEECSKTDYLSENKKVALEKAIITIFSPKYIGGLNERCFKIRGLFQSDKKLIKRLRQLRSLYPQDRIHTLEIGKWSGFSEDETLDDETILKQLNFCMKKYLDQLKNEEEEFNKRKDEMMSKTEQEENTKKKLNRRERRNNAKKVKNTVPKKERKESDSSIKTEDDQNIEDILNYLEDDELKDKYAVNKDQLETVDFNV